MADPGWLPDPTGRFEHRYWNGTAWTEHVARAGRSFEDALTEQPSPPSGTEAASPIPTPGAPADTAKTSGFGPFVTRTWRGFRRWPTWAQITTWVVVAIVIIAAIASGGSEEDNAVSSKPTTTREESTTSTRPSSTTTTTTTRPPAPTTTAPPPGFAGTATFVVGQTVPPGLYVSKDNTICYWQRSSDASGSFSSIIDNDNVRGQGLVEINAGEVFTTRSCSRWSLYTPPLFPLDKFGDGTWVVGSQVPPGRWQSTGGSTCYWERQRDHTGGIRSIAANDNVQGPTIVDIINGDAGFKSQGCGTWTRIG